MSTLFVRRLRLGAAFVLLTYVCLHFVNHALGIVSLDAMAAGRWWFLALWRSAPGTLALYGAIAVHGLLALRSEEHTSELQSRGHLVCRLLLEKKKGVVRCGVGGPS